MAARTQGASRKLPPPPVPKVPPHLLEVPKAGDDTYWCRRCQALTVRRVTYHSRVEHPTAGPVRVWIASRCACGASPAGSLS